MDPAPTSQADDSLRTRIRLERRRAVRYGLGFGILAAGLGSIAFGPDTATAQERVAALGAMVAPVATYGAWLAASRRRMHLLLDRDLQDREVRVDAGERVRRLLESFDAGASADRIDPLELGRRPFAGAGIEDFRRTLALPADATADAWRTLRPARGSTRPA